MSGFKNRALLTVVFAIFLVVVSISDGSAQKNLSTLKKQKIQNEKEILFTNKLLKNTLQNKENSLSRLVILNRQIKSREALIYSIEKEISRVSSRITATGSKISAQETYLKKLKDQYARSIYYAYKHRDSHQKLMFLFSAKDFNQAYRRFKYLQQYSEYSKLQGKEILSIRDSLNLNLSQLRKNKLEKESLLVQKTSENRQLSKEKSQQNSMISQLKKKERKLRRELAIQQKQARKLEKAIQDIIKREAQLAARKKTGTGKFSLTPEEKLVSDNFGKNMGHLPWPTRSGDVPQNIPK